jgi:4-amino-4-deoxy-L-arabinose transferase-like glycosyltransferase
MASSTTGGERLAWPQNGLGAIIDYAVASHARAMAVLVLVSLLAFLPGFFQVPPVDRDEARFAQATKQMVESGDYIDIRFQDEVRYKKPVGIYWLQAGVVKTAATLGVPDALATIWLYRIPSLIGAAGAVLLTYWAALAFISRRAALLAALMMAASIILGVEARLAKTDAVLLAATVAAMGALARAYLNDRRPARPGLAGWIVPAIFWTALAAGILLKGPLIFLFVGLAVVTLVIADRSAHWLLALRPLPGAAWLLLLVLPWFVAIVSRSGASFFAESVGQDLFSKVVSSQEAHGAPPGYYLLLYWVTFFPAATLTLMAIPSVWAARREKGARFLIAWIVPAWIVLELVVTKLPHYVLPLYPAIAILIAGIVDPHVLARERWLRRGIGWWFILPTILAVIAIAGSIFVGRQLGLLAWPFLAAAAIFGLLAWLLYETDGAERSLLRAMASSILVAIALYAVVFPSLSALFPSPALARVVREATCANPQTATAGYHEPSLVFLVGTSVRHVDGSGAADFLRQGPCRFAMVEARSERSFLRRAETLGLRYTVGPRIEGFNISNGRAVSIAVYHSETVP